MVSPPPKPSKKEIAMYSASYIVRESFRNWCRAAKRMFQPNVSFVDRLLIPFGLIFAQPLATISALFDFKLFRLNRMLNRLQRAMNTPVVLPENEAERKETLRWVINTFFPADLLLVGLGTSKKFRDWYDELYADHEENCPEGFTSENEENE